MKNIKPVIDKVEKTQTNTKIYLVVGIYLLMHTTAVKTFLR